MIAWLLRADLCTTKLAQNDHKFYFSIIEVFKEPSKLEDWYQGALEMKGFIRFVPIFLACEAFKTPFGYVRFDFGFPHTFLVSFEAKSHGDSIRECSSILGSGQEKFRLVQNSSVNRQFIVNIAEGNKKLL